MSTRFSILRTTHPCRRLVAISVALFALVACGGSGSTQSGLPPVVNIPGTCLKSQSSGSAATIDSTKYTVNGTDRSGLCGYVLKAPTNVIPIVVKAWAKCKNVGTMTSPPANGCNTGGDTASNRIFVTDKLATNAVTRAVYSWSRPNPNLPQFFATQTVNHRPAVPRQDYWDEIEMRFMYLGSTTPAVGKAEMRGQVRGGTIGVSGAQMVPVNQASTWTFVTSGYDPGLFRYQWLVNGALIGGASTSSLTRSLVGPGPHRIEARVEYDDLAKDTVFVNVTPELSFEITGPASIPSAGTYAWQVSDGTGNGSPASYAWYLDTGSGSLQYAGSGATFSMYVDGSLPSPFGLQVSATGSGFGSATRYFTVTNQSGGGSCGGLACLKAPNGAPAAPRRSPTTSRTGQGR